MPKKPLVLFCAAAVLAAAGCKEKEIEVYRLAKDLSAPAPASAPQADGHDHAAHAPGAHPPEAAAKDPHAGMTLPPGMTMPPAMPPGKGGGPGMGAGMGSGAQFETADASDLKWQTPSGWAQKPGSGMRHATLLPPGGAELSVIVLPGDAGGDLNNFNRWRAQIGLPPWDAAALSSKKQAVASKAGTLQFIDCVGEDSQGGKEKTRLLGAILTRDSKTWFFKMTGPDAAVGAAKPSFLSLLKSLHPAERG